MTQLSHNTLPAMPLSETFVDWTNDTHPDPRLRFKVSIPANLSLKHSASQTPGPRIPGVNLARLNDPQDDRGLEIVVQASWIEHELLLHDYYKRWAEFDGETLIASHQWGNDGDQTDILTSRTFDDNQCWLTRRRGFKVGNGHAAYIITINCACEAEKYEQRQAVIDAVMDSFQLTTPPVHPYAEPLRLIARCQPVDFASYVPISWKESSHVHGEPGPTRYVFIRELHGAKSGVFSIFVADKDTFPKREDFLREAVSTWEPLGLDAQEIILESTSNLGSAQTVRGSLRFTSRDSSATLTYSLGMIVADFDSHWFHAEVVGPSADREALAERQELRVALHIRDEREHAFWRMGDAAHGAEGRHSGGFRCGFAGQGLQEGTRLAAALEVHEFGGLAVALQRRKQQGPVLFAKMPDIFHERPVIALDAARRHIRPLLTPMAQGSPQNAAQAGHRGHVEKYDHVCARHAQVEGRTVVALHHPGVSLDQPRDFLPPVRTAWLAPSGQPVFMVEMNERQPEPPRQRAAQR